MKKKFIYFSILCFIVMSCKKETETSTDTTVIEVNEKTPTLLGVWELTSYTNYGADGVTETIPAAENNTQIKMYTEHKIMWSRFNAADSTDWFGYGEYDIANDELTETLQYGSKSMNNAIQENEATFTFDLVIKEDTFSQVSLDEDGHPIMAENYKRIEDK